MTPSDRDRLRALAEHGSGADGDPLGARNRQLIRTLCDDYAALEALADELGEALDDRLGWPCLTGTQTKATAALARWWAHKDQTSPPEDSTPAVP